MINTTTPSKVVDELRKNIGSVEGDPLTKDNVLGFIEELAAELSVVNVPQDDRWVVLPSWAVDPHRTRRGRRSKKRVQKKKVPFPMFLKGTRWARWAAKPVLPVLEKPLWHGVGVPIERVRYIAIEEKA